MSKDKPEVGDVWKVSGEIGGGYYKAFKVVVINTINFIHPYCLSEDNEPFFMCEGEAEFKYLGKWWLNEIVKNHRYTPISTAEKALKDLKEYEE